MDPVIIVIIKGYKGSTKIPKIIFNILDVLAIPSILKRGEVMTIKSGK